MTELEFLKRFNSMSELEHSMFGMKVREKCAKLNNNGVAPETLFHVMRMVMEEMQ